MDLMAQKRRPALLLAGRMCPAADSKNWSRQSRVILEPSSTYQSHKTKEKQSLHFGERCSCVVLGQPPIIKGELSDNRIIWTEHERARAGLHVNVVQEVWPPAGTSNLLFAEFWAEGGPWTARSGLILPRQINKLAT